MYNWQNINFLLFLFAGENKTKPKKAMLNWSKGQPHNSNLA